MPKHVLRAQGVRNSANIFIRLTSIAETTRLGAGIIRLYDQVDINQHEEKESQQQKKKLTSDIFLLFCSASELLPPHRSFGMFNCRDSAMCVCAAAAVVLLSWPTARGTGFPFETTTRLHMRRRNNNNNIVENVPFSAADSWWKKCQRAFLFLFGQHRVSFSLFDLGGTTRKDTCIPTHLSIQEKEKMETGSNNQHGHLRRRLFLCTVQCSACPFKFVKD